MNFIIYNIDNLNKKNLDINDQETEDEILN